jgi:hypothetical protein
MASRRKSTNTRTLAGTWLRLGYTAQAVVGALAVATV